MTLQPSVFMALAVKFAKSRYTFNQTHFTGSLYLVSFQVFFRKICIEKISSKDIDMCYLATWIFYVSFRETEFSVNLVRSLLYFISSYLYFRTSISVKLVAKRRIKFQLRYDKFLIRLFILSQDWSSRIVLLCSKHGTVHPRDFYLGQIIT